MFRVKFTLTKLQKTLRKTELRQITQPQKNYIKKKKKKLFILQTHVGQANRKPKAKQNAFQIKKTLGCQLTAFFKISPHKIISKKQNKTKLFILQTHVGQANRKPKAKQNAFQIKKTLGCRLTAFFKISENFYFLLKG